MVGDEENNITIPFRQSGDKPKTLFRALAASVQIIYVHTFFHVTLFTVQSFMWQEDLQGVAKFVTRALESFLTLPGAVRP